MCMRTGDAMGYPNTLKEGTKLFILASPIGLHSMDFPIKFSLNQVLKVPKNLENIRFLFKKIYPSIPTIIINEANIVGVSTH